MQLFPWYKLLIIFNLLITSISSQAITNIEKARTASSELGLKGHVRLRFSGKDGNNEETKWGLGGHGRWSNEKLSWLNWYSRDYQKNNGYLSDDHTFLHSRLIHNHQEFMATEYFIQYEQDPFAGLKRRLLQGIGLRFHSWHKANKNNQQSSGDSFQGIGLFNEHVREVDLGSTQVEQRYRGNLYSHWLFQGAGEKALSSSITLYLQPDLAETDDVKALLQAQLTVPIHAQLHLQWQWQSNWDSRPPTGIAKEVHETKVQFKYSF